MKKIYGICAALVLSTSLYSAEDDGDLGLKDLFAEPKAEVQASKEDAAPAVSQKKAKGAKVAKTSKMDRIMADPSRLEKAIQRTQARIKKTQQLLEENKQQQAAIHKERTELKKDEMDTLIKRHALITKGEKTLNERLAVLQSASIVSKLVDSVPASASDEKVSG